jgi:hypothetical protein
MFKTVYSGGRTEYTPTKWHIKPSPLDTSKFQILAKLPSGSYLLCCNLPSIADAMNWLARFAPLGAGHRKPLE